MENGRDTRFEGDRLLNFAEFAIDEVNRVLYRDGKPVPLTGRVFDLLVLFAHEPHRLLTKDEIIERVWNGNFVEEGNVARAVSTLRKALGDAGRLHRFIATVQGRGYKFIADVSKEVTPILHASSLQQARFSDGPPIGRRYVWLSLVTIILVSTLGFGGMSYFWESRKAEPFNRVRIERLTSSGQVRKLALSPKDDLIAYVSVTKDGESLSVAQPGMNNGIVLVPPRKGWFSSLTFSPDGRLIYYGFFPGDKTESEVYSVPTLGGPSRRLPGEIGEATSISPDGSRMAFVSSRSDFNSTYLNVVPVTGGESTVLATRVEPASLNLYGQSCAWSPDGRSVAFIENDRGDNGTPYSTVVLADARTGAAHRLTQKRWSRSQSVIWETSSMLILSASDAPNGPRQIWQLNAEDGSTHQITNDLGQYVDLGVTSDNSRIFAVHENETSELWLGNKGGQTDATRILAKVGRISSSVVTDDGKVIYRSNEGDQAELWMIGPASSSPVQITVDGKVDPRGLCITSGGREMVFPSSDNGRTNLWIQEISRQKPRQLTHGDLDMFPTCSADGKYVVFQSGPSSSRITLWTVAAAGGEPTKLTDTYAMRPSISPDGSQIAYFYMSPNDEWRIGFVGSNGQKLQSIALPAGLKDRIVRWSSDGRSLLFVFNAGDTGNLWRMSTTGQNLEQLTSFDKDLIDEFSVSPNGQYRVFSRYQFTRDAVSLAAER